MSGEAPEVGMSLMEWGEGRAGMTEAQHLLGRAVETELWVGDLMFIWGVMQGGDGEPDVRGPCVLTSGLQALVGW